MTPLPGAARVVRHRQEEALVSESSHPTLDEIAVVFAHLADRVAAERARSLDPVVRLSIARAVTELRRHIPGLYAPPDAGAAAALGTASADALRRGRLRAALARALRGLSFSPHNPELHYLAASACLQFGATEEAVRLLQHSLWIHPGYQPARQDLESLAAFHEDPANAGDPDAGQTPASRFEMLDEERQGQLWPDEDTEGWERAEGEFPDDDTDERAA
jgi:Flp pilus assembly protein TadD